ncbi:PP2C family protein-serine/threonine phosphatase [Desulfovibrio sp.]
MSFISKPLDSVAGWSVRRKMDILLAFVLVLPPLAVLLLAQAADHRLLNAALVAMLAASVILFMPLSALLSHLLALRNINQLNTQCLRLKEGRYTPENLPPEQDEEHDFLRLKRNLNGLGLAIQSRERRLSQAIDNLADARRRIEESIEYAGLIQRAFLPGADAFAPLTRDHFLLWSQRDGVGGDACWIRPFPGGFLAAVIDCTGHGVPGAFMTLIVHSLFDKAAREGRDSPAALLSRVNALIKESLGQTGRGATSDDGMDCAVCRIESAAGRLTYAGARIPLLVLNAGEVEVFRGDSLGAGYVRTPADHRFSEREIALVPGQRFYLATDGLADTVGGPKRLPFGRGRFIRFILEQAGVPLADQAEALERHLSEYRGGEPRRDDLTVLGFEVEARS